VSAADRTSAALLAIIAAGIAIRLLLVAAGGTPQRFEYDDIARHVIAGQGYVYDQLGTPYRSFYAGLGYMAINIVTDWLFPETPKAMLAVQSIYAGLLALVAFAIARRFTDDRLATVAAALTLTHPALLYYDVRKLHPLGFDSLMMMLAVWTVMRLRDNRRPLVVMASGMVLGLAIFQRGSMALFLVGAAAWLSRVAPTRTSDAAEPRSRPIPRANHLDLRTVGLYVAGALIVLTPWAARNYAVHHIAMLESMTWQQFWKGNATYSNGSGYLPGGRNVYDAAPERLQREWRQRDEAGQFRLFRDEGIAEVRKDPARAAGLMLKKFVYFWTAPPNAGQEYPRVFFAAYLGYYVLIVVLSAIGLSAAWQQANRRADVAIILIYLASVAVVHALMFVEMRHRWATEPVLLALVPAGASALWNRWSRSR